MQWAPPPGEITPAERDLLRAAEEELKQSGVSVSDVLCEARFAGLRARTEFRELVAKKAKSGPLTICGPEEPGTRMVVTLKVLDMQDKPVEDALVYVYHTSAKGWYSDRGAHIRADSGDIRHARLFGYGRTAADGSLEIRTIRPSGYPHSELPAHIHLGLEVKGQAVPIGEIRFEDDPRMTPEMRKRSDRDKDAVVSTTTYNRGVQHGVALFKVQPPAGNPKPRRDQPPASNPG
ncbi:MAG: hypothetical protein ACKVS9_04785 [Phycisphaerae bacterium]